MRPVSSGARVAGPDSGDLAVGRYEALWRAGRPSLERYWAEIAPVHSLTVLGQLAKVDLQNRFDLGEAPTAAEYLERLPELADSGERAVSLIYEEFCLLEERGEAPDSGEFCDRYGPWRDSLHSQIGYHRELSRAVGAEAPPTVYPRPGDRFANYQLRSLLGRGGAARVYLATDDELDECEVALKISASIGREPSILAKLDHRNIVPILRVTRTEAGLQGFCMPYRPGVTLEALIHRLGTSTPPRSARAVWEALAAPDAAGVAAPAPRDDRPGWSDFPIRGTYAEAIAWIGLAMANALAYLHGKGVLHRDIKPANVLLAYREGPQLLDFNLSHAPSAPENAQAALKGGTLPFMAPEQLRAFLDPESWSGVGAPADIYALGLVLRGLLTGQRPELPNSGLPLARAIGALHDRRLEKPIPVRQFNPGVPPTLESIIAKCLEFEPSGRYPGATELAEDLRRFLDRRPLKVAENTSAIERGVNCVFRNRRIVVALGLILATGAILSLMPAKPVALSKEDSQRLRRASIELDSDDPAAWEKALEVFRGLSRAYSGLGEPAFYEALALEKTGTRPGAERRLAEADRRLDEAASRRDFDDALYHRFRECPETLELLTKPVEAAGGPPRGPSIFRRAYARLRRIVDSGTDRVDALGTVAVIERALGHPDEAIRYCGRALALAEANPEKYPPRARVGSRMVLLPLLTAKADAQLDSGPTLADRRKARAMFEEIEETRKALLRCWKDGQPREVAMFRDFYRAAVASGLAALDAESGEPEKARSGFEGAKRLFNGLLVLFRYDEVSRAEAYEDVGLGLRRIEERSRRFLPDATAPAPTR